MELLKIIINHIAVYFFKILEWFISYRQNDEESYSSSSSSISTDSGVDTILISKPHKLLDPHQHHQYLHQRNHQLQRQNQELRQHHIYHICQKLKQQSSQSSMSSQSTQSTQSNDESEDNLCILDIPNDPEQELVNFGLELLLQQKLNKMEEENEEIIILAAKMENEGSDDSSEKHNTFQYVQQLQEMMVEKARLKKDLERMLNSDTETDPETRDSNLLELCKVLQEELQRQREECIHLHYLLADHKRRTKNTDLNCRSEVDIVNEELIIALEEDHRLLMEELQEKKKEFNIQKEMFEEIIKQYQSSKTAQKELNAQINKLKSEKSDLTKKHDKVFEECRKYKEQVEILQEQLRQAK